jgi:hypothetical protein
MINIEDVCLPLERDSEFGFYGLFFCDVLMVQR